MSTAIDNQVNVVHLKELGEIFISRGKKLIEEQKGHTLNSLCLQASNDNFIYTLKTTRAGKKGIIIEDVADNTEHTIWL